MNNLFNYARSLPEPFDKLANKKAKISSKYGSGTEATLCATVIKAVHAVCNCMNGTGEGAIQCAQPQCNYGIQGMPWLCLPR